jgi:predicted nucleotidyltransferase
VLIVGMIKFGYNNSIEYIFTIKLRRTIKMISIEDKIEDLNKYFKKNENILAVYIVGSYGTQFQREESDIDFAILV